MLEWTFYDNTLRVWLIAAAAGAVALGLLYFVPVIVARQITRISSRTRSILDDAVLHGLTAWRIWLVLAISIWVASHFLVLSPVARAVLGRIAIFALLIQLGIFGTTVVRAYVQLYGERKLAHDGASVTTVRAIGVIVSVALWLIVFLVILENLGVNVTALVAGLGIGGVAVALAVQKVLEDVLASLSIVLDKPFVVGDFIVVGELAGTVENVGLKTTRVRSLSGEQLVFANSDLLESRIRNYKRMYERRVAFTFGIEYDTPREKIEWIPGAIREIIEGLPDVRFDRAHFTAFSTSSLDFEVVYYVLHSDYDIYMDRQQAINLGIRREFDQREIAFAFPTTTIHLATMPEPAPG